MVSADYADPKGQGRITVVGAPAEEPEAPADWADVDQSAWYAAAVNYVIEHGVMGSTDARVKVFTPNGTVTRAQTVTFLYRAAGSPAASGSSFTDVPSNAYYAAAVRWAVSHNITSGTSSSTFSPNGFCTRGQIVTFLYRDMA